MDLIVYFFLSKTTLVFKRLIGIILGPKIKKFNNLEVNNLRYHDPFCSNQSRIADELFKKNAATYSTA
jgi:hypothetical protein